MADMLKKGMKGFSHVTKKVSVFAAASMVLVNSFSYTKAEDFCTEDFGMINTSFSDVDNLGFPIDWKLPKEETNLKVKVDTETYHSEPSAVKLWYDEGFGEGNALLTQSWDKQTVAMLTTDQEVYFRAWVKTENLTGPYEFQIATQQAAMLAGPPWFKPKSWDLLHTTTGSNDWMQVTGSMTKKDDEVNGCQLHIQLRSDMPCTVWVDDIELSTNPDFDCQTTSLKNERPIMMPVSGMQVKGSNVLFDHPTMYRVQLLTPSGRQCAVKTGYGSNVSMENAGIAPGVYIAAIESDFGEVTHSLVISATK